MSRSQELLKRLFFFLVACGAVYFGRELLFTQEPSDDVALRTHFAASESAQALAAYHEAALRVVPYSESKTTIELAISLGKLEPTIDRANGCEHLWDMLRISRRLSQRWRHFLNAQALYNMALCVSDPDESASWLAQAEHEASWAKNFKTSSPALAQRRNDLYEAILRRRATISQNSAS